MVPLVFGLRVTISCGRGEDENRDKNEADYCQGVGRGVIPGASGSRVDCRGIVER